jgi:hypothetical protein
MMQQLFMRFPRSFFLLTAGQIMLYLFICGILSFLMRYLGFPLYYVLTKKKIYKRSIKDIVSFLAVPVSSSPIFLPSCGLFFLPSCGLSLSSLFPPPRPAQPSHLPSSPALGYLSLLSVPPSLLPSRPPSLTPSPTHPLTHSHSLSQRLPVLFLRQYVPHAHQGKE